MTRVSDKTLADPMTAYEDGMSVPGETRCSAAPTAKAAETTAAAGGQVDTFETLQADPRRVELERINEQRRQLKPELDKKREEALRALPKMLPVVGTVADVGFALRDAAHGEVVKAALGAGKSMAETKLVNVAAEHLKDKVAERAGEAAGELAGGAVQAVAQFKDGYVVTDRMIEYGKAVREDEALRRRAEDLEMQLDPSKKFDLVRVNGQNFSRQGGRLVSDQPQPKATEADNAYLAALRRRQGL